LPAQRRAGTAPAVPLTETLKEALRGAGMPRSAQHGAISSAQHGASTSAQHGASTSAVASAEPAARAATQARARELTRVDALAESAQRVAMRRVGSTLTELRKATVALHEAEGEAVEVRRHTAGQRH